MCGCACASCTDSTAAQNLAQFSRLALARRAFAVAACTLVCLCCGPDGAADPDTGGVASNTRIGLPEFVCLTGKPLSCDCNAAIHVHIPATGKGVFRGSTVTIDPIAVQLGHSSDPLQVMIRNPKSPECAAALQIKRVDFAYTFGHPDETEATPGLSCFQGSTQAIPCSKATWKQVIPIGMIPKDGQATMETLFLRYTRFDAKDRTAKVTLHLGGLANVDERTFTFFVKTSVD